MTDEDPLCCPHCGNDDPSLIDVRGNQWFCAVCAKLWYRLTDAEDRRFLRELNILPPAS